MSSEPDHQPEKESSLIKQPEHSNEPKTSKEVTELKVADKEIGQGDVVSSLNISETSPNDEMQDAKDDDIEVILDSADDDEDLHLKWDDDEEIEDDIISLNIPPSPIKEEIQSELKVLPEKDKEQVIDKDLADDELVVGTEGDEEIILMDDESDKVANTTPNSAEQSFQSMLLDIDNICAEIDNHTKTMDENQAKNKSTVKDVIKPSIIDDLILIEDDDITLDSVSSVKTENSLDENNIIKEMSYEQIEMDNNEKVGETQELDIKTNEQDVMEIDLLDDESEKPKEVISALVKDNSDEIISGSKSTGSTGTQMESDEMEKQKSDKSAAIKDNNDVIDSVFKVTETQLGSVESEKPKDVKIAVNEDTKDILAECKAPDVEMVEIDNSVNKPADDSVIENDIVASSPNESLLDPSCITENLEHGLNKPDMMLEIPTQEVIEFLDETDVSIDLNKSSESAEKVDIENEVTDNKTSSETNKNNIELTANSDSLPDPKKLEENSKLIDTIQNIQDSEQIKEIVAMDVTENIKDTVASETKLDNIKSKDENFTSTKDCEEEQTTELKDTDNASISESEIVVPHKPIDDTSSEYLKEKDLGTESEIIQHKPSDTDTIIEKDLNTESDIVVQETSANTTETIKLDSTLSKTVEVSSKTNLDKEKPSTSKEIKLVSPIEPQPSTSNVIEPEKCTQMELEPQPTTSQDPIELEKPSQMESEDIDPEKSNLEELGPQLLTSNVIELEKSNRISVDDELQEVTDSLGLLAESSGRVMDDDEEPEDEEDDDDFDQDQDQDESSNQMTAEHSEDSNAQQSETDGPKEPDEKITESPLEDKEEFNFDINSIVSVKGTEEEGKEDVVEKEGDMQERDGDVEVDDFVDEVEVTPEQIGDVSTAEEPTVPEDVPEDAEDVTEESAQDKPTEPKQAVEVETVKLSDTSDSDADAVSLLRNILEEQKKETPPTTDKKTSAKKVMVAEAKSASFNFVDLEESSSEDDVQEVKKKESTPTVLKTSAIEQDVAATEVPKTPTKTKTPRINTSEISIRTISSAEAAALPQIQPPEEKPAPKFGLEVFSLDSDEEDATKPAEPESIKPKEEPAKVKKHRCINLLCKSVGSRTFVKADAPTLAYYDAARKKRTMVCEECANAVVRRTQSLVDGIKEFTPLLLLDIAKVSSELVEISDSESEEEEIAEEPKVTEKIGELGVKLLEEHLADMINQTWKKFKLDARLTEAQDMLNDELKMLEEQSKEIDTMLTDCQVATDKLRKELYATFEQDRQELTPLIIFDIPTNKHSFLETESQPSAETTPSAKRRMSSGTETPAKRPHTDAIPLGYSPIENTTKDTTNVQDKSAATDSSKLDDDKDISVLQVSAEVAPPSLPPPGPLTRPPLRAGAAIFAMRNVFGSWLKGKILEVQGKATVPGCTHMFTICKVKFEHKARSVVKLLPGRCLAYCDAADVRMTIGTRVIALFKDTNDVKRDSFYSGIVAEVPNPVNKYRYLVFFDDGYAQYVRHEDTRLVCECASLVWEEVHPYSREFVREYLDRMTEIFVYLVFFDDGYAQYVRHEDTRLVCECASLVWEEVHPYSREFVREYLMAYPERPMVRLHAGQSLKTEWNGKWWSSRVIQVDASLVHVHFEEDNRTEWIYRGSTRLAPLYLELQAAERHRARPMPRTKAQPRNNMPYVEYTRSDEQNKSEETAPPAPPTPAEEQRETRQRSVAKKSTTPAPASARAPFPAPAPPAPQPQVAENVTSRVVYYTPKNAVRPHKMVSHVCGPHCKRSDVLALKDLRTYNPLAKPLLSGWERQIVRLKGHKEVMYRAPCGRRVRNMRELHRYLRITLSDMAVDLFDFAPNTHCLAEFVLNSCLVGKKIMNTTCNTHCLAEFVLNSCLVGKKDLSHGKENVPVPCVNYYDDSLPEFCSYNTERTPTAGVPLNLDPEFLCGCDCTDDCEDKSKCACWRMTMEGARTIGMDSSNVGYVYRRLPEPLPTGIYECNSRCKCKQTCLNRVAQHPLQLKLQVFKTLNRGWGIRALNDVPKGSFLCVYAGNLLTDATANMDGLNEGDEYLAELDYIEVVEQMKEGYEEDIPNADKRLDKKNQGKPSDDDSEEISSSEEEDTNKDDQEDYDFRPAAGEPLTITQFSKRLRKREKKKMQEDARQKEKEKEAQQKNEDDCITISDDEEVREPSRFTATAGMVSNEFKSKYRSVRTWFGKDEACYIMDAKVQGNIGRYLNHSCTPNVFVQNVFVDTHDPRFPWVAFFALCHIKAGTELTWNYNYDVGSVPGKVLYCYCGAPNCRGRLL